MYVHINFRFVGRCFVGLCMYIIVMTFWKMCCAVCLVDEHIITVCELFVNPLVLNLFFKCYIMIAYVFKRVSKIIFFYFRYGTADKCSFESRWCSTMGSETSRWQGFWHSTCCSKGKIVYLQSTYYNKIAVKTDLELL